MQFWSNSFTGIVQDHNKWTDTSISGGQSFGNGHRAPVRTHQVANQEFFLNADPKNGGEEKHFHFQGWTVPMRPGHKVTVAWGNAQGKKVGPHMLVKNHTTNELFANTRQMYRTVARGGRKILVLLVLGGAALFAHEERMLSVEMMLSSWLLIFVGVTFWHISHNVKNKKRLERALQSQL